MTDFVPQDFVVPLRLERDGFLLEPLGPQHNVRDHDAWMSSIEHIRGTPGFPDGTWPRPMTEAENMADLERHASDFSQRKGFTFTVLDGDDVIGCVYIYPSLDQEHDAAVSSWVRVSHRDRDVPLWKAVTTWLAADWPFESIGYDARP